MKELLVIVWQHLRPHKRKTVCLMILSIAGAGIAAFIPLIYGWLVDQAMANATLITIGLGLLLWLVLSLVNNWFRRIIMRHADNLSAQVESGVIIGFAEHFLNLPVSFLKNEKIGKMINKSDRAAMHAEAFVDQILFNFLPDIITIGFILALLLQISSVLSGLLLLVLAIYILVTVLKGRKIMLSSRRINRAYSRAYGDHYEYLSGYQTVRACSAEDAMINNLKQRFKQIIDKRWKGVLIWSSLGAWQNSIFSLGFVGLFGLGMIMLRQNSITPGNLVSFVGYIAFVFGVLGRLGMYYNMFNRSMAEVSGLQKIMGVKTESQSRPQATINSPRLTGEVIFDQVSFGYENGEEPVLFDISFEVKSGETIALVGESGAGKTTLVDLVCGDYLPKQGQVLIDGFSTDQLNPRSLRRRIATVPQEVVLFNEGVAFNINYGNHGADQAKIEAAAKAANAHDFISKFRRGYESKVGERGVKLSVGQKQRIAIARALLADPDILILDEATSSLDSITEKAVQEALERLIKGRTTFIIAHRLSTIVHADRIFVLDGGRIVQVGNHQELVKQDGVYRGLYLAQKF